MLVVLAQQRDGQHEVVDVVEDERVLVRILLLLRQEGDGVVAPMPQRVEMVRGVVAVVVAVAVALWESQYGSFGRKAYADLQVRRSA